jgi:glycosyltransferase involved in cell wall biosynthesis
VDVVRHPINEGYGKSLQDGVLKADSEIIVTIDADLEYPPECIPELVDAITGDTHVVYGSRFLKQGMSQGGMAKRWGNSLVTGVFNALYGQNFTDLYTGVKAFKRSEIARFRFRRSGFDYVVEMAAYLSRSGAVIAEVPVSYTERTRGSSKMRHVAESLKAIYWIVLFKHIPIRLAHM